MTEFAGVDIVDLEPTAWRLAHLVDSIPDECDQSAPQQKTIPGRRSKLCTPSGGLLVADGSMGT